MDLSALPLGRYLTPGMRQAVLLFSLNMVTNGIDYLFHFYLGRNLLPADFAIVQTMNALLIIAITACAVLQPVIARFVAAARAEPEGLPKSAAYFQYYFRWSALIGLGMVILVWLVSKPAAAWLNVPPAAVGISATMLFFAMSRPVVHGLLQATHKFVAFGLTRMVFAGSRLLVVIFIISVLGGGDLGSLLSMSLGATLSLLFGLVMVGRWAWQAPGKPSTDLGLSDGWRLSANAFVAYLAFMIIQSSDLVWVNRLFTPVESATFATAILFRRILAVLPTAVIFIMFPKVAALVAANHKPDRIVWQTAAAITLPTIVITGLYFLFGTELISLSFGSRYATGATLIGWMGLTMIPFGLSMMWLNFFLATKPAPYLIALVLIALVQTFLLSSQADSLFKVIAIFGLSGVVTSVYGLGLYLFWLRPHIGINEVVNE